MKSDKKHKEGILLEILKEKYLSAHEMRNRSLHFTLWVSGFLIIVIAWLFLHGNCLNIFQKALITLFLLVTGSITFLFIKDIHKGFNNNKKIMEKIEKALGLFKKSYFLKNESIYPDDYLSKENKTIMEKIKGHFFTLYVILFSVFLLAIFATWTSKYIEPKEENVKNYNNTQITNN